jgi:hypothetical protein
VRRASFKGASVSLAVYVAALALGFLVDFRLTLFAIPAIQVTWTLFCIVRAIQLRVRGAHRPKALSFDREDYGFAIGGFVSSVALLLIVVVLTQVV